MINRGCEVNYCFKKGFILNEEHLQTISSMIRERYQYELIYRITKRDSYIYQTSDINEILDEENGNANLINKLVIAIDNESIINFNLCFEKGEATTLKIVGEDKDKIFLLYNEIKIYVEKEVTTVTTFLAYDTLRSISSSISSLLMLGLLFFLMIVANDNLSSGAQEAIDSTDVLVKLNYLIDLRGNMDKVWGRYMYVFIPVMVITITLIFIPKLVEYLFGKKGILRITDYFLIGKQKSVYEKKIKMKNNIIWSIGIAFLVSIVAGLVVYVFTK